MKDMHQSMCVGNVCPFPGRAITSQAAVQQPAQERIQFPVRLLGISMDSVLIALACLECKTFSLNSVFTTSRIKIFELK